MGRIRSLIGGVRNSTLLRRGAVVGSLVAAAGLSGAGVIAGLGLFVLSMLAGKMAAVAVSSVVLSFGAVGLLSLYLWLTA